MDNLALAAVHELERRRRVKFVWVSIAATVTTVACATAAFIRQESTWLALSSACLLVLAGNSVASIWSDRRVGDEGLVFQRLGMVVVLVTIVAMSAFPPPDWVRAIWWVGFISFLVYTGVSMRRDFKVMDASLEESRQRLRDLGIDDPE